MSATVPAPAEPIDYTATCPYLRVVLGIALRLKPVRI